MNVIETPFEGLMIIEPRVFNDDRGYFFESFNERNFESATGFNNRFVQDNQARSTYVCCEDCTIKMLPTHKQNLSAP